MRGSGWKKFRFFQGRAFSVGALSLLIILTMLACYIQQPRLLRLLDHKIYDTLLHAGADGRVSAIPIIVDLDEASVEAYGQWPWPRYLMAELLTRLKSRGVAAVGLDILLAEEDRTSPRKLRGDLSRFLGREVFFEGLPDELLDFDQLLAESLDRTVVLGMYCHFTPPGGAGAQGGAEGGPDGAGRELSGEDAGAQDGAEGGPDGVGRELSGEDAGAQDGAEGAGRELSGAEGAGRELSGAEGGPDGAGRELSGEDAGASLSSVGSIERRAPGAPAMESVINRADGASLPLPVFRRVAPLGMINMNPDEDGVVRRLPLIGLYKGDLYASLALRTLMAAMGVDSLVTRLGPDGIESVRVGRIDIPLGPDGSFIVPFRGGAYTFPYYSVKDILEDKVPEEALRGKIAFVGTSAPGLLDIRISPLERVYPGVEVHATALDAIISQTFLRAPAWTPGAQALSIVISGLLAAVAFGFAKPRVYIVVAALLLGGVLYASFRLFQNGFFFSPLYTALTVALLGASLLMLRFWQEERQKNVLRSAFSRYVAPEVVERITRLEGDIFAGEERELSIMFTDIRGFTGISEKLLPQQIVQLLNRYFTPMTALVRGNKGTLDKFIGDALMAFWNAPVEVPGHPGLAVKTALEMHERLGEINGSLLQEFGVSINMGVGVHTGKAYVGNMGSEELLNYTLIGDNVNLASRLEGLCAQFGVGIVISSETRDRCDDSVAFQPLDTLRVKGKRQPVSVFAAMRPEEWREREQEMDEYMKAYGRYVEGDFAGAGALFAGLAERFSGRKLYALYAGRCEQLRNAPPTDWDGVWTLHSK